MSRSLIIVFLTAALAAACTIERGDVRTPSGEPPEADTVRVRRAIEAIALAFENGDLSTLDTIYHDSVTVFESGMIDQGWIEYRDGHLAPEMEALRDRRLLFDDIRVHLAGSTAWATCQYSLSGISDDGQVAVQGVVTMVFRKLAGRWRLVVSHSSTQEPARSGG
jgi:ketosteroid isomerase-like protein